MPLIRECHDYERGGTQKDEYTREEVVDVPCPLCSADAKKPVYVEHGAIVVSQCSRCSLIYTSTRFRSPETVYWGDADAYYTESRLIYEGRASHHRDPNYLEELRLIERYKKPGRILDVGCNMGMLLRLAMARGWEAVGVEPSPSLTSLAMKHGFKLHSCFLHEVPDLEAGSFDVVALSDVFEHICEPLEMLAQARRFLKDDGILYVKVPNARWNVFKQKMLAAAGRKPKQGVWDSYEHVVHYTSETLRTMLDRGGFDTIRLTTGKPIQIPVWQEYVGRYYAYPSPWILDWRRHLGRALFYYLARVENVVRLGSIGYFSPCLVAVAKKAQDTRTR